jgi:N-acetylglutamate synthase-like GNAT family acetyltransferase
MENVRVEVYAPKYQEAVISLILNIQRTEFGVPITLEQQPDLTSIPVFYQKGNGNFWVALVGDRAVGTIALIDIGSSQIALRKMFVHESYRGQVHQTGQKLLDIATSWMQQKGCTEVFLGTLDIFVGAQKFYRKNGFDEIPQASLPENFPRMALDNTFFKKRVPIVNNVVIFTYTPEYQPWFEKFNREWIEKYFWMEAVDFQVLQNPEEHIIDKGGTILMAQVDKEVAGTVALKFVEPGVYEFTKMAVDDKFRGKKVGLALAEAAIAKAKTLGANKIILYSNTVLEPAISLYRKIGFREIPVDGPYKRSNMKMELPLIPQKVTVNSVTRNAITND